MDHTDQNQHRRPGFSSSLPYPELKVTAPNRIYAEILMDDYSGIVSEFTAVNQYLYHHFVTDETNKEVAKMIENIAIVEMLHMEMLASLILKLGGNPVFRGGRSTARNFWNGRLVYYGKNLCNRLEADLDSEFKAIKNYEAHIKLIDDPYIQNVLRRIILDEDVHIKLFENALEKYCRQ
jgi:bacterioferritin